MLEEFFTKITGLSFLEIWTDIHGGVAILSLVLFGSSLTLYFMLDKVKGSLKWLKVTIAGQLLSVIALDLIGLLVYMPYRGPSGAKSLLVSSEATAWLHEIVFEHKEFLAFAPVVLLLTATIIVYSQGDKLLTRPYLKKAVLFTVVAALVMILVVAAEAVLVTKAAPQH